MKCPFCGHVTTQVIDIRMSEEDDTVCHRRRCKSCSRRFTTYEHIELFLPAATKKNGSRVDYGHDKVKDSMRLALRGRPVSAEAIDETIARIGEKLLDHGEEEIGSGRIGKLVMRKLKRLDKTGYVRFTSVYRSFEDLAEFRGVLDEVAATNVQE